MRKFLLPLCLLSVLTINARRISLEEAQNAADAFFNSKGTHVLSPSTRSDSGNEAYYAFNAADNQGFVIISGDDRFSKVLGYSDRGSFDITNLPPQLKAMLDNFAENCAKSSNNSSTHPSWSATNSTRADEGVLLKTAEWGQWAPFNDLCPTVEGKKAPTGCVATAMAIAMKYHNWPDYTRGDVQPDYYHPDLKFDFSKYTIDWKALEDKDNPKFAEEASKLMFSAGVCNSMAYGPEESAAYVWPVGHKMIELYSYSKDNQFIVKEKYSDSEWEKMIKDQIQNVGPVIYSGDGEGSHCFIIDGYDNSDMFHINWGWDGEFNGYYLLGVGEENGSLYPYNQAMIINLKPDKERKVYSKAFIPNILEYSSQKWNFTNPDITPGEKTIFKWPTITANRQIGYFGLAVVDENDNIKKVFNYTLPQETLPRDCPYPGVFFGVENEGGIVFPPLSEGERYQIVTQDATVEKKDEYNWKWTPEKPSDNPADWKIVLGGIDYPSYFYASDNNSDVVNVTLHIDENLPIYFESINEYPKSNEISLRHLKGEGFADHVYIPRKGMKLDVECRDKEGNLQDPIFNCSDYDGSQSSLSFALTTTYHDSFDLFFRYEYDGDSRNTTDYAPQDIEEVDGLIYNIDGSATLIGYDNVESKVTIPEFVRTKQGTFRVREIEPDALLHAPIKDLVIESPNLSLRDVSCAGMDKLENIYIEDPDFVPIFHWGFPFLKSPVKNVFLNNHPSFDLIKGIIGFRGRAYSNYFKFGDPFDKVAIEHNDINYFINSEFSNPDKLPAQMYDVLNELDKAKKLYGLEQIIGSYVIPGVGENSGIINQLKKFDVPVKQMWSYSIDKANKMLWLNNVLPEVKIGKVTINGVATEPDQNGIYHYSNSRAGGVNVGISYTVNDSKEFSLDYPAEYNNSLPDFDIQAGVGSIVIDYDIPFNVFSTQGISILTGATSDDLRNLPAGLYIIRQGNKSKKFMKR